MTFPFRLHTGWLRSSGLVWQLDGAKESDFYRRLSVLLSSLLLSSFLGKLDISRHNRAVSVSVIKPVRRVSVCVVEKVCHGFLNILVNHLPILRRAALFKLKSVSNFTTYI